MLEEIKLPYLVPKKKFQFNFSKVNPCVAKAAAPNLIKEIAWPPMDIFGYYGRHCLAHISQQGGQGSNTLYGNTT